MYLKTIWPAFVYQLSYLYYTITPNYYAIKNPSKNWGKNKIIRGYEEYYESAS
jgi:hypothetical protein